MKHAKPVFLVRCPKYNRQTHRYEGHEWREVYRDSWAYRSAQSKGRHRQGTSYRRNPLHQKKDLTEHEARLEWKKRKKDWKHRWKPYGRKQTCITEGHRARRRWESLCLMKEQYEELSPDMCEIKLFIDRWDWN